MKRSLLVMLLVALATGELGHAQQANQNINVLPVYYNDGENVPPYLDENGDPQSPIAPDAYLKGDLYLQRQVEPTIVESTRNPDHLLAFFVDYRPVDIPDDVGLGQSEDVAEKHGLFRTLLAKLFGRSKTSAELPAQAAAAEAWIGGSESYNGGTTWSGFMVPGLLEDSSPASVASPIYGLEAATDPVAAPAPCGAAYLGMIAFTRGGESKMVVARYRDLNNLEGGATWVFDGMSVVETGNNAEHGHFIDKPFILVDPERQGAGGVCAHNVYVSYSTFNGLAKDGKFQSKVNFAHLFDDGASLESSTYSGPTFNDQAFYTQTIHKTFKQNQGTWMAVDPRPETPSSGGGGTVYVFWRHFFDPDAILMRSTSDFGQSFTPQPKIITGDLNLATFDQLGISTASGPEWLSFRSNGFPTATVSTWDDGLGVKQATVMVAFQERVDPLGFPDPNGSPRIMLLRSQDEGDSWTDAFGNDPEQRQAVDIGSRDEDPDFIPAAGFGALPQPRSEAGPQVMQAISCGAGRCMLTYYESRGLLNFNQIGPDPDDGVWDIQTDAASIEIVPNGVNAGFISDIRRLMDLRAAKLDPVSGALDPSSPNPSIQVSRYAIRADADLADGEWVDDVMLASGRPCFPYDTPPNFDPLDPATQIYPDCFGEPALHRVNKPQSGSGSTPFIGDYNFLIPIQRMVPNDSQTGWRWLVDLEEGQYDSFRAIWTDNRNLIRPEADPEYLQYSSYGPPGIGGGCVNVGSRNTDVLTALVEADLILQAPTTFKQLDANHSFPLSLMNAGGSNRFYRLTITEGAGFSSFALLNDIDVGGVQIFPYSSISQIVYVDSTTATGPIRVEVREITGIAPDGTLGELVPGGASGLITFNSDGTNPSVGNLGDIETLDALVSAPEVTNPFALNPFALNPFALNGSPSNPFALNPFALNPFALNSNPEDVVDTTWTITAGESDTASSYLALPNIDNIAAFQENYAFQLLIYRTSSVGSGNPGACESYFIPQDQIISSVVQNPFALNPFALNPFALNPFALNPFALNPFALNSAFTMAPTDAGPSTGGPLMSGPSAPSFDDGTTRAPRASNAVKVTLRAYPLNGAPDCSDPASTEYCFNPLEDPPSLSVIPMACGVQDPNWTQEGEWFVYGNIKCKPAFYAPDLVPQLIDETFPPELITADGDVVVTAGDTFDFPYSGWDLLNQGNSTGTAENTILRHGFYLSTDEIVEISYDGISGELVLGDDEILLGTKESELLSVGPGESQSFTPEDAVSLTIPASLPPGDYNLIVYVDDRLEVSEVDELNNFELAQFAITVEEPNTAPVATDDSYSTDEDTPLSVPAATGVLSNDTDVDADDVLTVALLGGSSNGILTLNADGSFDYTPNANFNGSDSFTYLVNDGELDSSVATVSITVNAVNDAPEALSLSPTVNEDGSVSIVLSGSDLDGDGLSFAVVTPPTRGTLSGTAPNLIYTPGLNFNGSDSFTYVVNDGVVDSAPATVSITVDSVNDAPVADDQSLSVAEDGSLSITLAGSDVDGDPLNFAVETQPGSGTLTGTAPNLIYAPDENFNGSDGFTFVANDGSVDSTPATVSITVTPVNDAPILDPADPVTVDEDGSVGGSVSGSDVDGDALTYSIGLNGAKGTADILDPSTGNFTYTPSLNEFGNDSFTIKAFDGLLDSNEVTVTVTINAVNDPPTAEASQSFEVPEDSDLVDAIQATDVDPGTTLTFTLVSGSGPLHGSLELLPDGNFTYSPDDDFDGTDGFSVEVCDDAVPPACTEQVVSVSISVTSVNDAPVAESQIVMVAEDDTLSITLAGSDVDGDPLNFAVETQPGSGTLTGTAPNLIYAPDENFNGSDGFTFKVNDGELDSSVATVSITVSPVNDAPVLADGSVTTDEDISVVGSVSGSDVDGDGLTYSIVTNGGKGTAVVTNPATGTFSYTPAPNENGDDSFTMKASDGLEDSNISTVAVTITPINDPPVPLPDSYVVQENGELNFDPKANDIDVDSAFVIVQVGDPDNLLEDGTIKTDYGRVRLEPDNTVTYWPDQNYEGPAADVFLYVVEDDLEAVSQAEIEITVDGFPPDWAFVGLLSPYQFPEPPNSIYTVKLGSALPVRWQYADLATGLVVESSDAEPMVRVVGPVDCSTGSEANGEFQVFTPGNSTYQYDAGQDIHQLNVDTDNLIGAADRKCFNAYTESGKTLQIDGPFLFRTRK